MKTYHLLYVCVLTVFALLISGCGESGGATTGGSATQTNSNSVDLVGSIYLRNNGATKRLLGAVQNNANENAQFVEIDFTFYNSSNKVIDTDYCYIDGHLHENLDGDGFLYDTALGKGDIGYFDCYVSVTDYAKVSTKVSYTNYDSIKVSDDVQVDNLFVSYDYNDNIKFTGMIKNNSSKTLSFVEARFFILNSDGQLIDSAYSYVNGSNCGTTQTDACLHTREDGSFEVRSDTKYEEGLTYEHRVYYDYEG